jgi:ribosomal protein L18E
VKILGQGELKAKLAFEVYGASKSAVAAIEKAGGSVKLLAVKAEAAARSLSVPRRWRGALPKGFRGVGRQPI